VQGSARKDGVFGAACVYTVAVPGPKRKSWVIRTGPVLEDGNVSQIDHAEDTE
jgi:hypothetical protein